MATIISNTSVLDELLARKIELEALKGEIEALEAVLITRLGAGGSVENDAAKATVIQATTITADLDSIAAVNRAFARKVSKTVLDQGVLSALRKGNAIPKIVLPLLIEKPGKPYVKITKR